MMEMVLNRQMGMHRSDVRVGVVKDHIRIPDSIMKVYQTEGTFPMNFQMLYMKHFDNPGLIETLLGSLQVKPLGSMHRISNIDNLQEMDYVYERLIVYIKQNSNAAGGKVARPALIRRN